MRAMLVRFVIAAFLAAALVAASDTRAATPSAPASVPPAFGSQTVYAQFDLASLPTMVDLCNSGAFLEGSGYDLLWVAGVGFNASLSAYETLITAHTPLRQNCGTPSPASLESAMQATLFHLDPNDIGSGYALVSSLPVTVDIAAGRILVQANRSDPALSGLADGSQAQFFTRETALTSPDGAFAPLDLAAELGSTYPRDDAASFAFGDSFTDPADDVCTANLACASAAHAQIDLVGGSLYPQPIVPPPVFGGNTIDVEFKVSALPTMVDLCNSAAFVEGSGYDLLWVAGVGFNASLSAYETLITAHTVLRQNCGVPVPASLESAMQATLFHLDPNDIGSGYAIVSSLPVSIDVAGGSILVEADRSEPALSGLAVGAQTLFLARETALTSPDGAFAPLDLAVAVFSTYPRDDSAPFAFGDSFTDPAGDVCTANLACASAAHAQIDLVAGTAHMVDYVFRGGFE
jgi:hypothetical protein